MNVLLTNDDGIHARGLWALYRRFSKKHLVTVIAPDRQRSAIGHAITLHKPIRCNRVTVEEGFSGYAVSGTPADCIKIGINTLLKCKPDMVISGINPGANVGINVNYSGTVCAAREAGLYGITAISVSIGGYETDHYADVARFIEALAERIVQEGLPAGTVLNVNIPDIPLSKAVGVRISRQEMGGFEEQFEKRTDPRNRTYYWQGCEQRRSFAHMDSDGAALEQNYITITPLVSDLTDYPAMEALKRLHLERWIPTDDGI